MPLNTLTTEVGLKVGPVLLETLVKHYVDPLKKHTFHCSTFNCNNSILIHTDRVAHFNVHRHP
ncbi:hypothetical protein F5887DRAFT_977441 [Amanita rubescens]|nr:hypothetical protein F5887DRAFT_977441 [Amanita rubescens]